MSTQTIRDRLWIWGMQVNLLQSQDPDPTHGCPDSTLTTEEAMRRTGITNVLIAGALPLTRETLDLMPSAKRIIAKWAIHKQATADFTGVSLDAQGGLENLLNAKRLAASDRRVEAYLLDDFSTGAVESGVGDSDIQMLAQANALHPPMVPLMATIYTMTLDDRNVQALLPHFAGYMTPLWHAADIKQLPADVDKLADLSGGKPQLLCIYLFDFGNGKPASFDLMRRQLEVAEQLIRDGKVFGSVVLGQCLMDLPLDAVRCFNEWLEERGDEPV